MKCLFRRLSVWYCEAPYWSRRHPGTRLDLVPVLTIPELLCFGLGRKPSVGIGIGPTAIVLSLGYLWVGLGYVVQKPVVVWRLDLLADLKRKFDSKSLGPGTGVYWTAHVEVESGAP